MRRNPNGALIALPRTARAAQMWHWNSRRKVEQYYADVQKAQAAK